MTLQEAIKERVIQLCNDRKITVNKLATISSVPQSTLNNIMHGYSKKPNTLVLYKVATAFNMTLSDFFDTPAFNDEVLDDL